MRQISNLLDAFGFKDSSKELSKLSIADLHAMRSHVRDIIDVINKNMEEDWKKGPIAQHYEIHGKEHHQWMHVDLLISAIIQDKINSLFQYK